MSEDQMKKVVEATEKSFQEKVKKEQEDKIKKVVQDLLEKIEKIKDDVRELTEKKRALETDLEFLKKGRIDLIKEHTEKTPVPYVPIQVFPIYVEKIVERPYQPWNQPWSITYGSSFGIVNMTTTGADVRNGVIGTYSVSNASGQKSISIF